MTDLQIDMSEVVYAPEMVLEVRSAMNGAINSQNNLMTWLMKKVDFNLISEEETAEYHRLIGASLGSVRKMMDVMETEVQMVGDNTPHLR